MTAREAGTPTRLVRSNALFDALSFMRCRTGNLEVPPFGWTFAVPVHRIDHYYRPFLLA